MCYKATDGVGAEGEEGGGGYATCNEEHWVYTQVRTLPLIQLVEGMCGRYMICMGLSPNQGKEWKAHSVSCHWIGGGGSSKISKSRWCPNSIWILWSRGVVFDLWCVVLCWCSFGGIKKGASFFICCKAFVPVEFFVWQKYPLSLWWNSFMCFLSCFNRYTVGRVDNCFVILYVVAVR